MAHHRACAKSDPLSNLPEIYQAGRWTQGLLEEFTSPNELRFPP